MPTHIAHLSSSDALTPIYRARAARLPISAGTCPHYLFFAAEEIPDGAVEYKCAPPIRERANRELLWAALAGGLIQSVVSNHRPAPASTGSGNFLEARSGIASLQLGLSIVWTAAGARNYTLEQIVRLDVPVACTSRRADPERIHRRGLRRRSCRVRPGRRAHRRRGEALRSARIDAVPRTTPSGSRPADVSSRHTSLRKRHATSGMRAADCCCDDGPPGCIDWAVDGTVRRFRCRSPGGPSCRVPSPAARRSRRSASTSRPLYAQARTLKICPHDRDAQHLPVLLGQLRRHHPHARRQGEERHPAGRPRRRRSRSSDQSRHALSRRARRSSRTSSTIAGCSSRRCAARAPITGKTSRWDQAIDEIGALGEEDARRDVRREGSRRAAPSTAAKASRGTAAAPTPTSSIISSSRRCAAWGSATWKTRPGFDTGPRSPVWGPHSDAAR